MAEIKGAEHDYFNGAKLLESGDEQKEAEGRQLVEKAATAGFPPALLRMGDIYGFDDEEKDIGKALEYYDRAIDAAKGSEKHKDVLYEAYFYAGVCLCGRKDDRAKSYLLKALEGFENASDPNGKTNLIICLCRLGDISLESGDTDRAEEYYLRAEDICARNPGGEQRVDFDMKMNAEILKRLRVLEERRGNIGKAREYAEKALELHERLEEKAGTDTDERKKITTECAQLCLMCCKLDDADAAVGYAVKALDRCDAMVAEEYDNGLIVQVLPGVLAVGKKLTKTRGIRAAADIYERMLATCERASETNSGGKTIDKSIAALTNILSLLYSRLGDNDAAGEYLSRSMSINDELVCSSMDDPDARVELATNYVTAGDMMEKLKMLGRSEQYYTRAIALCESAMECKNAENERRTASLRLGRLLTCSGRMAQGIRLLLDELEEARSRVEESGGERSKLMDAAECCGAAAMAFMRYDDYINAIRYNEEALALYEGATEQDDPDGLRNIAECCSKLAGLNHLLRKKAKAEMFARRAVTINERLNEQDGNDVDIQYALASAYYVYGTLLDDDDKQKQQFDRALEITSAHAGDDVRFIKLAETIEKNHD